MSTAKWQNIAGSKKFFNFRKENGKRMKRLLKILRSKKKKLRTKLNRKMKKKKLEKV